MTIEARLPDGRVLNFPDGTDPAVIQATVKKVIANDVASGDGPGGAVNAGGQSVRAAGDIRAPGASPEQDVGLIDRIGNIAAEGLGNIEAAASIGSSIVAEPIAGIAGLVSAAVPGGQTGGERVRSVQQGVGEFFAPSTEAGQRRMEQIGGLAEFIPDVGKAFGDFIMDKTGSPELATIAASAPTAIGELLGVGALRKVKAGTRLLGTDGRPTKALKKALDRQGLDYDNLTPEAKNTIPAVAPQSQISRQSDISAPTERVLLEQIKSGGRDEALAGVMAVRGQVVPDRIANEVMRQGYRPAGVQAAKAANPQTRRAMEEMLTMTRRIGKNERLALDFRPTDVAGKEVVKRLDFIMKKAGEARTELNQIARTRLAGQPMDTSAVEAAFFRSLDDLDVRFELDASGFPRLDDRGAPTPIFEGSVISKNPASRKAINDAIDLLSEDVPVDALRFHKLKRQFDDMIDFNKKAQSGLTDSGRNALKQIRGAINDSIRAVDDDYARVNDVMSKALTARDDFKAIEKASIRALEEGGESAVGTDLMGLMSNRRGRQGINKAVNSVSQAAEELGGSFPVDIRDLIVFANTLEDRHGAIAKSGLQSNIERGIKTGLREGVGSAGREAFVESATDASRRLRGIDDLNAFNSMEELLRRIR